jgi:hypothetical protein
MISTARVGGERLVYVGCFGPQPERQDFSFRDGSGSSVAKRVKQAIDNAGGRAEHILYHDQYEPGQVIFTAYIPAENLVSFVHAIGGDKRIKTLKRAMAWIESRKHVIDLVNHWADKPVGSRNGYKPLVTARVAGETEVGTEQFIAVVLPLGTVPGKAISDRTYKTLKSLVAKIMSKGKVAKYSWLGSLAADIGVVSCVITDSQLRDLAKAAKSVMADTELIAASDEEEMRKKAYRVAFNYTMTAVRQNGFARATNVVRAIAPLTALSVIEARIAYEGNNMVDVAWYIGNYDGNESIMHSRVSSSMITAESLGLRKVKLLGYWKAKQKQDRGADWLGAVLVAKMPTENPDVAMKAAYLFNKFSATPDNVIDQITTQSKHTLDQTLHEYPKFCNGKSVLSVFKKV